MPRFGYLAAKGCGDDDSYSGSRPGTVKREIRRNKDGVAKLTNFISYAEQKSDKDTDLIAALQQVDEDWDNLDTDLGFYLHFYAQYKARETYNKLALADNLMQIWQQQGHEVIYKRLGKITYLADERQEIRETLDQEEAALWAETDPSDLSLQDADTILSTLGATPADRRKARKRKLQDKLPNTPLDTVAFCLKVAVEKNGRFRKTTELLWMAQNPDAAKYLDRWSWTHQFSRAARTDRMVTVHHLSVNSGKAKLLHECPLQPFIDGNVSEWVSATPEAIAVHEWALLHARQFRRFLRLTISPKHTPTQTVNKLLRKLGYEADQVSRKGKRDDRECQYAITNREDIDREIILKALTERFLSKCEEKKETPPGSVATEVGCDCGHSPAPGGEPTHAPAPPSWFSKEELDNIRQMWDAADCEEARSAIKRIIPLRALQAAVPELGWEALAS